MQARKYIKNLFLDGLEACSPERAVSDYLQVDETTLAAGDQEIPLKNRPIYLFAVGKAAVPMYQAASGILEDNISGSLVITTEENIQTNIPADEIIAAAHPYPDERSVEAGEVTCDFFEHLPADAILITLISGGTSSLMCLPPPGVTVDDIHALNRFLIDSGSSISEINTVRKHCSRIKGGQLLRFLDPEVTLVDLVISDVPGNDLSIIGSGPTSVDSTTFEEAKEILKEYDLWNQVESSIRNHIDNGISGAVSETVRPGEDPVKNHQSHIISSPEKLKRHIGERASGEEIKAHISGTPFNSNVKEVANRITDKVLFERDEETEASELFVFYGESTVNVTGNGLGGRNQDLALRLALLLQNRRNFTVLCADTDGIDGPTDAAGAIVDTNTISKAEDRGMDPEQYLADNDSYHFHQRMGTLLKTGPTRNNLMDLVLVLDG